jgi:hypothetical protein
LFCLVFGVAKLRRISEGRFWPTYVAFLGLYWMTAPLAWLYAIPVERLLPAYTATLMNLIFLGTVSLWRVLLITRVVSVVFHCRYAAAFPVVMLFADVVVLFLLYTTPLPIIDIMGGIRLTESEDLILGIAVWVGIAAVVSFLVWLVGTITVASRRGAAWRLDPAVIHRDRTISLSLWGLAAFVLLCWLLILPRIQQEQRLRMRVERNLRAGNISEAVSEMARHPQSDFPPHWNPPPLIGYGETAPHPELVLQEVTAQNAPGWIRQLFEEKVENSGRAK